MNLYFKSCISYLWLVSIYLSAPSRLWRQLVTLFQVYSSPQSFSLRLTLNWNPSICTSYIEFFLPQSLLPGFFTRIPKEITVTLKQHFHENMGVKVFELRKIKYLAPTSPSGWNSIDFPQNLLRILNTCIFHPRLDSYKALSHSRIILKHFQDFQYISRFFTISARKG